MRHCGEVVVSLRILLLLGRVVDLFLYRKLRQEQQQKRVLEINSRVDRVNFSLGFDALSFVC